MNIKNTMYLFNLRKLSEESKVSYQVLKNYMNGRTKELKKENEEKIVKTIKSIIKE